MLIFFLAFKIYTQINTQKLKKFFLYLKLSNSKFARDLQNTQTQNSNPDLNLFVLLGAFVWVRLYLSRRQMVTRYDCRYE